MNENIEQANTTSILKASENLSVSNVDLCFRPSQVQSLIPVIKEKTSPKASEKAIDNLAIRILLLLAAQSCGKNILMRYVMKGKPQFLHSSAIIVAQLLKLFFVFLYIQFYEIPQSSKLLDLKGQDQVSKQSKNALVSIFRHIRDDSKNTMLLIIPASAYSLLMSLEYVAFAHMNASTFAVLVQTKMLTTAIFFWIVLKKKLRRHQLISLLTLTAGVILCSIKTDTAGGEASDSGDDMVGMIATLGIAITSGFASVYTEKIIKAERVNQAKNSLAHMQAQMACVSLIILGLYAIVQDYKVILEKGFFYKFNGAAFITCLNSAVGGLIVAAVLKYADSVLKGYASACAVVLTGILSKILFGTSLSVFYGIGLVNVVCAVVLYNGAGLDKYVC